MTFNQPMCCPNPDHDKDPDWNAGMNINPHPQNPTWWRCGDCGRSFEWKNGLSTLI